MIKGTAQRLWVGTFINLQKRDSKLLKTFRATDLEDRNQIAENISSISFIAPPQQSVPQERAKGASSLLRHWDRLFKGFWIEIVKP